MLTGLVKSARPAVVWCLAVAPFNVGIPEDRIRVRDVVGESCGRHGEAEWFVSSSLDARRDALEVRRLRAMGHAGCERGKGDMRRRRQWVRLR